MDLPDPSRDPGTPGWVDVGQAAAGTGHPLEQIQFADINADGLADYLVVLEDGSVLAWLNNGTEWASLAARSGSLTSTATKPWTTWWSMTMTAH